MQTIVLDYSDWKVFSFSHSEILKNEAMEIILTEKYDFRLDEIERMTVESLEFVDLWKLKSF